MNVNVALNEVQEALQIGYNTNVSVYLCLVSLYCLKVNESHRVIFGSLLCPATITPGLYSTRFPSRNYLFHHCNADPAVLVSVSRLWQTTIIRTNFSTQLYLCGNVALQAHATSFKISSCRRFMANNWTQNK